MATILIVKDEGPISERIRRNLQLVGHTCVPAFDGPEALGRRPFDPLLDIMLPGLDGFFVQRQAGGVRLHHQAL